MKRYAGFALATLMALPLAAGTNVPLRNWKVNTTRTIGGNALNTNSVFVAITPCRVLDTRDPDGPYGGPKLPTTTARTINMPGSACSLPIANAYSVNITVFGSTPSANFQFLTAYPGGTTRPNSSSINFQAGAQVNNGGTIPANATGDIDIYSSLSTHVVIDVNGYFIDAPAAGGAGDITGVIAGTGLTGGATSGDATLGIANGGVDTAQLADASVKTAKIDTGAVTTNELGDNAVTTAKIADANVTTAKIADANVTLPKLDTTGATTNQVVTYNGTATVWATPINAVSNSTVLNVSASLCSVNGGTNNAATISLGGLNGNHPEAVVIATPNSGSGVYTTGIPAVGVAFVPNQNPGVTTCSGPRWIVYTLDGSSFPAGAKYSIFGAR